MPKAKRNPLVQLVEEILTGKPKGKTVHAAAEFVFGQAGRLLAGDGAPIMIDGRQFVFTGQVRQPRPGELHLCRGGFHYAQLGDRPHVCTIWREIAATIPPTAPRVDYYAVLGIPRTANAGAIKAAYRKLALQFHPDKNPGDAAAAEKFREAAEAHGVLSDPEKKAAYDAFGH